MSGSPAAAAWYGLFSQTQLLVLAAKQRLGLDWELMYYWADPIAWLARCNVPHEWLLGTSQAGPSITSGAVAIHRNQERVVHVT
jgi:hypothetical protein